MNKSSRTRIDQFIADEVAPTRLKGSEAMALKADKSIIKLVDDTGASTTAGRYWAKKNRLRVAGGGLHESSRRENRECGINSNA